MQKALTKINFTNAYNTLTFEGKQIRIMKDTEDIARTTEYDIRDKILIVEDDEDLSFITKAHLDELGYCTETACSCREARECIQKEKYDLILLDLMLPDATGIDLCSEIRKSVYCPIIFMSCIGESDTVISALKEGGDDYVVKPMNYMELAARIEANIRRKKLYENRNQNRQEKNIYCGTFYVSTHTHNLHTEEEEISLSPIEYKLIMLFLERKDELLLYEELYRCIWGSDDLGDVRTVMVHVSNLRKKLEKIKQDYIQTVRGAGYIFVSNREAKE